MSNSIVLRANQKPIKVKNLGWLLRNWSKVVSIGFNFQPKNMQDGELIASMRDGFNLHN